MERSASRTIQLRSRGVLTLPKALRDKYDLGEGDALYLVDVGGTFVLTPMQPMVPSLAREIERLREEAGLSTEQLPTGRSRSFHRTASTASPGGARSARPGALRRAS
jgi:bifunctional DNA-binding transcriptional regulator/antitoxin component of YhaV-PrlF toxin-antitoxin module